MRISRIAAAAAITFLGVQWVASPLRAGICFLDDVPAATLLLPYFEVDLGNSNGVNTLMSINNSSPAGVLAHVVLWSDVSVPTFTFNIYLTGYDVQTFSLRELFVNGTIPRTASVGQDPADTISPRGAFSQDINFASCNGQLPPPLVPTSFITHLRAAHTGNFSAILGACAGRNFGDNIARGYVTVDVVNNCTLRFPGDAGYFTAGGMGDATNQNVLWGDYFYINPFFATSEGETLVHIEASAKNVETSAPGQYTFYGRYVNWTAADNREPLGTQFATRYLTGQSTTDLVVWRDSKVKQNAFKCGTIPTWYPLGHERILPFDELENVEELSALEFPFPTEAQKTRIDGFDFPVSFPSGWLFLDLNTTVVAAGANPPEDPAGAQAWVTHVLSGGTISLGFDAVHLDSACQPRHKQPGPP